MITMLVRYALLPAYFTSGNALGISRTRTPRSAAGLGAAPHFEVRRRAEAALPHADAGRDLVHGLVNVSLNHAGIGFLPLAAGIGATKAVWLARRLAILAAGGVRDPGARRGRHPDPSPDTAGARCGVIMPYTYSVQRMYGLKRLMTHPLHRLIERAEGTIPPLLLGIPPAVASAVGLALADQLVRQHANFDYRAGRRLPGHGYSQATGFPQRVPRSALGAVSSLARPPPEEASS